MSVKIEPRSSGIRFIGDWGRVRKLGDPPDDERRALEIEKNPVPLKHAKIPSRNTDPLVKVRMRKTIQAALDGIHSQGLEEGRVYEMLESLARSFVEKGYAVKIR